MNRFELVETADGSFTARFSSGVESFGGSGETMHSLRGAFGETVYIYGEAFRLARTRVESPRVLSLGLGLGLVEIVTAALSLTSEPTGLLGESFEIDPILIENFRAWLEDATLPAPELKLAYDVALMKAASQFHLEPGQIKNCLKSAVKNGDWKLSGAMDLKTEFPEKFQCIAFDAFSSKSTPELWSREFLDRFLREACDKPCVLSTYACTGHLKRALAEAAFTLKIREGYASKRDSTLATR